MTKLIQIAKLIAPIALAFVLNAAGTLIVASLLHVAGASDLVALGSGVAFSVFAWKGQINTLSENLGD